MTIQLPVELESSIAAFVQSGRFRSMDDAMAEAARLLLRQLGPVVQLAIVEPERDPILGLMRDDAELMDEIVADAYRQRQTDTWRDIDLG